VGLAQPTAGNAVARAHLDFLNHAVQNYPSLALRASGEAVGVAKGQMGNSEVGHLTMGCGQIISQGNARISQAFADGSVFQSKTWQEIIQKVATTRNAEQNPNKTPANSLESDRTKPEQNSPTLHFAGIFSDGGVHSDIAQLEAMIKQAYAEGVRRIRVHAILDGRDVPPQSAEKYITRLENFFQQFATTDPSVDFRIASGGGRMVVVADRYENDWGMVRDGWNMMVHGQAPYQFSSATAAIAKFRADDPDLQDQYCPAFVIVDEQNQPVGKVQDGDAFIYFDFRADRAIEIAMAFTYNDFPYFNRGEKLAVYFAGLTEYNSDTHVPEHRLIEPIKIENTLHEFLSQCGKTQLAVSETVKFGHITYYFDGMSYDAVSGEEFIEIPSDTQPFNTRPWMKSAEITDVVLENLDRFDFVRVNFPGGDMVGHFGEVQPTITALEAIDLQLARLAEAVDAIGGMMIITADHGNAEELLDSQGQPITAHTTNPVPCVFYDNTANSKLYNLSSDPGLGLANLAATVATLLGQDHLPENWQTSLIEPA